MLDTYNLIMTDIVRTLKRNINNSPILYFLILYYDFIFHCYDSYDHNGFY